MRRMKLRLYQVDAFTDRLFSGNPAGVVLSDGWLPDRLMQAIAAENNLSETAFVVPEGQGFGLRWFTPVTEVDLCGHATLASAHVLFNHEGRSSDRIDFLSPRSGTLTAMRQGEAIVLDFPADRLREQPAPPGLARALGRRPLETWRGRTDLLCLFGTQSDIAGLRPDMGLLAKVRARGVMVTAKGDQTDIVSRFFGPRVGVPEDPVTGSAHTTLAVFWAPREAGPDPQKEIIAQLAIRPPGSA
ncbi:MAG: PhzF family phenazine biosynthesis protein [Euryarchaeota archaeon]|nr:PhzF family phenazine biosynthesis protein [Euryarchaeota archaeon]